MATWLSFSKFKISVRFFIVDNIPALFQIIAWHQTGDKSSSETTMMQWQMLLSSSNHRYQPYTLLSYFSVVVGLRCLLHHFLSLIVYASWENWEFVFIIIVHFMMSANSRIHFGLQIVFVCSYITPFHYHHWGNLSEDIKFIKCLSDIFGQVCE